MTDSTASFSGMTAKTTTEEHPPSLSDLLQHIAMNAGPKISLRDLAVALEDRSFGAFLVVFALPNLVPMPPGATLLLGLPLIFVAWQILSSNQTRIWLPRRIADYTMEKETFVRIVGRVVPWLRWIETWIKPRFWFLETRWSERLLGIFTLVFAIVVFLPIPFGNWLPALALAIIGLAMTERDGVGVIAGAIIGVISTIIATAVALAAKAIFMAIF
ncbi:exopolysaccharide biosynthesis protein [Rhizobium sp. NRK18]|uniref:exopolysaccharide biosynthesis protein n=1 Tax=Rhizobium sp. NRK18 TaxID=2964667 RepID=UPI0021C46821|nr:exopolysaccharide biosynthesis protein [Rhizobium sp. NRK18]MCQ2003859.1 exopolysaccharide biosynthesis protein [Rhizobium sp. NRK18]